MAIRVKKLAKELRTTSEVVLSVLAELGYDRYKSEMDMVADPPAAKLRKRAAKGLPAAPPALPQSNRPAQAPRPKPTPAAKPAPWLADPGALDVPLDRLVQASAGATAVPDLSDMARSVKATERRQIQRAQAQSERERGLNEKMAELQAQTDALRAERTSLQAELERGRQALAERAAALDALEAGGTPLSVLLERRGLAGADEQGRALEALARARLLDSLMPRLRVVDPAPVNAVLRERLVLSSGPVDELSGVAVVQVSEDRAEVPGGDALDRARRDLAGEFLLNGLTRVRVVGGGPVALRLLRGGVDERVSLELVAARKRGIEAAKSDVIGVEALVLWGVAESADARAIYDASAITVLRIAQGSLIELVVAVRRALQPQD